MLTSQICSTFSQKSSSKAQKNPTPHIILPVKKNMMELWFAMRHETENFLASQLFSIAWRSLHLLKNVFSTDDTLEKHNVAYYKILSYDGAICKNELINENVRRKIIKRQARLLIAAGLKIATYPKQLVQ